MVQTLSDSGEFAERAPLTNHEEPPTLRINDVRIATARFHRSLVFLILLASLTGTWAVATGSTSAAPKMLTTPIHLATQVVDNPSSDLMLDEPVQDLPVVNDARWSSRFTSDTLVAVVVWVALLIILMLAGRPLSRLLFSAFPDEGQGFSRIVLLLAAGWMVWFASSYEVIEFRAVWAWYAVVAVSVIGGLAFSSAAGHKTERQDRRAVLGAEGAFWIVFAVFLGLRFFNPDSWHPIWGGEKPMEFAHINALLRTPYFPPFDPWFSGGLLNYYYYGEYLIAFLIKLTGIPSEIAFNLAQPTMLGLAASGMYSLVVALSRRLSRDRVDPLLAGGLGVVIFCLMGNLVAAWNLFKAFPDRPVFTFDWTWHASRAIDGGITEFPYFTGLYADLHAHLIALPVTLMVIGLGFALAASHASLKRDLPRFIGLSVCLGTLSAANAWDIPVYAVLMVAAVFLWSARFGGIVTRLLVTAIASTATGLLGYAMFRPFHEHFVALFNDIGRVTKGTDLGQFTLHFGGLLGILGIAVAASGLLSWSEVNSRWRIAVIVVFCGVVAGAIAWQVLRPQITVFPSGSSETVLLALLAAGALAMVLLRARADAYVASIAVVIGVTGMAYLVAIGWPVLAIGLLLVSGGALTYFSFSDRHTAYFGLLVAAAGSLIAGVELFFVVDDLASLSAWYRMNTIFKLYYEVWAMLSLVAGVALAVLISKRSAAVTVWKPTATGFAAATELQPAPKSKRVQVGVAACAVIIGLSLVYPAVATLPRLDQRFEGHPGPGTLDALAWMQYGTLVSGTGEIVHFDGDLAAIRWFQDNVEGTPVIAEASIGPYRGDGSRFSIALGLPAMLGWDRHERQQRYAPEITERDQDVRDLYNSPDVERKRQIIDTYGIEYIIVGDVERKSGLPSNPGELYASPEGLDVLAQLVGKKLEIVFDQDGTTVYRVIRQAYNV